MLKNVLVNALFCSIAIIYFGAFPKIYREMSINNLKDILKSNNILNLDNCSFSLQEILSDAISIGK